LSAIQVPLAEAQLAATEQVLSSAALSFLSARAVVRAEDLPFLAHPASGAPRVTPTTPPVVNVSLRQVAASAGGQIPASLGGFNRGLVTNEIAILLSGGGGGETPAPETAPTNHRGISAPVRPVSDDMPLELEQYLAPDVRPVVDGDAIPVLLAPASGPERLPRWEIITPPTERVERRQPAARPATPAVARPEAVAPRPSLWSRFVSLACFAAGALGAVWFPDIREPVLRQEERRQRGVPWSW
jgi:hypothetical protein